MPKFRSSPRKAAAALALAAIFLTGCTDIVDLRSTGEVVRIAATPAAEFPADSLSSDSALSASQGANDFALRFAGTLLDQTDPDQNFLCAPISAWLPLAALANATDGQRRPQLLEALGAAGLNTEQLNTAAAAMLAAMSEQTDNELREQSGLEVHNPLSIANAVFVSPEARLSTAFTDIFARDYAGVSMNVDFASEEAAAMINEWASEHTGGLIPEIVSPGSLDPKTVAALANAVYFSDRWRWEFSEDDTAPGSFHCSSGDVTAQFMARDGEQPYFEDAELQALQLRFVMGGSLLVLLPKNGDARSLLTSLDTTRLENILSGLETRTGRLLLPRFAISSGIMPLDTALDTLGVPLLDAADPPLDGLVDGQDVYISQAVQNARIEVDEHGTTAAAVTLMAVSGMALPPPGNPFEMLCDHPFAFLLLDDGPDGEDQILFAGVCADPTQEQP